MRKLNAKTATEEVLSEFTSKTPKLMRSNAPIAKEVEQQTTHNTMPAKLESCVKQLMAQGYSKDSAYAICNASVKPKPRKRK